MSLYSSGGLYGPVCDYIPATSQTGPIQVEIFLEQPNIIIQTPEQEVVSGTLTPRKPKICRTVKIVQMYGSNQYGPVCDRSEDTQTICPDETLEDAGENRADRFNPIQVNEDPKVWDVLTKPYPISCSIDPIFGVRCEPLDSNFNTIVLDEVLPPEDEQNKRDLLYSDGLICGAIQHYEAWGVYQHVCPVGVSVVDVIMLGAGGGAGGGDIGSGATAAGNNSGGVGSIMRFNIDLNPDIRNVFTIVVGQGGSPGPQYTNQPTPTNMAFNRGGRGGYPGPLGFSSGGGGGGGATDFYLNGRLIASAAGGGGGGGQGSSYYLASTGKPIANWNNYTWNNSLTTSSDALIVDRFPPLYSVPMFKVAKKHPYWSNWFADRAVWVNPSEDNLAGAPQDIRINLEFPTSGTYTFRMAGDNIFVLYIAAFDDLGDGDYIVDGELYNGGPEGIPNWPYIVNSDPSILLPGTIPSTLPGRDGAPQFELIGSTTNFNSETPTSFTKTLSAGRYVLKSVVLNNAQDGKTWDTNPAGMALEIRKPDNTILWDTTYFFGMNGSNRTSGEGPGAGGGGGNYGRAGLTSLQAGAAADSTSQGGSAGKSYIINHPSVNFTYFEQAGSGFHSGWQAPIQTDASVRRGTAGWGGARPTNFSIIFDGIEYPLYNSVGSSYEVTIPGMGQGVWKDDINGISFPFHYFWGVSSDDGVNTISGVSDGDYGASYFGKYEGAVNAPAVTARTGLFKPRSLELALWFRPVKTGSTWSTKIILKGIPPWGQGTGFALNDVLPANFPPLQSEGNQPWYDVTVPEWGQTRYFNYFDIEGTIPGQYFSFAVKITGVSNTLRGTSGTDGFLRFRYG